MRARTKILVAVSAAVMVIALVLWMIMPRESVDGDSPSLASDGKPYGVLINGIIYEPEMYDETFGHADDNTLLPFEEKKPAYLDGISYIGVEFPANPEDAFYFPAFVMYEAVRYISLPEEVMRKYLPDEMAETYLALEREGVEHDGLTSPFTRETAPNFTGIFAEKVEGGTEDVPKYRVIYHTTHANVVRYFLVGGGKILEEVEGSWFDKPAA